MLPTWWPYFTLQDIQIYQSSTPSQTLGPYWSFTDAKMLSAGQKTAVVLKLYPDILIFYVFIYAISLVAIAAQVCTPLLNFLKRRIYHPYVTMTIGEAGFGLALALMLVGQFMYWYTLHVYQADPNIYRSNVELAARAMGQVNSEWVKNSYLDEILFFLS